MENIVISSNVFESIKSNDEVEQGAASIEGYSINEILEKNYIDRIEHSILDDRSSYLVTIIDVNGFIVTAD